MPTPTIEEFGKILVQQVRDEAIQSSDRLLRGKDRNIIAKRWMKAAADGNLEAIAAVLIPDIVDDTLFHLLRAIDQELLQLKFTASNGETVDLPNDGELAGWYLGSDEWRARYSRERFVDDFADLQ